MMSLSGKGDSVSAALLIHPAEVPRGPHLGQRLEMDADEESIFHGFMMMNIVLLFGTCTEALNNHSYIIRYVATGRVGVWLSG